MIYTLNHSSRKYVQEVAECKLQISVENVYEKKMEKKDFKRKRR